MSQAERLSKDEARKFLTRQSELRDAPPCEHGHFGCSDTERGPCLDEVLHRFPELENDY